MRSRTRLLVLLWTAVVLTQMGCNRALPNAASPAPAIKVTGSPLTGADVKEFTDRMTQAVTARDAAAIDQLVRIEDLGERSISDLRMPENQRRAFLKGMTTTLKQAGVGKQIVQSTEGDGSYKLLRVRSVEGRPHPLFRLIGPDGAVNYHEYTLVRHNDGKVAAEDMYIYVTGEPLSQTLRRFIIPALAAGQRKGGLGKIDPEEVRSMETVGTMAKAIRSGDFKSAVTAYRTLPKKSQEQKPILIAYIMATKNLGTDGEADYLAAMQKFRQLYPEDAAVDFISIDYFYLQKRYDEARKSVDRLDRAVGGDPYLDVIRGNAWMEDGRFEEARNAMEEAIKKEPGIANAFWARISLSLREKKHAETLLWLQTIVEKCPVAIGNLNEFPEYAEFVKSPQHGEWQRWYASHSKGD